MSRRRTLSPLENRSPLRVMFMLTSMPIGGAECLLRELIKRLPEGRFESSICCLKERGPLGEELSQSFPVYEKLISSKYDISVINRLSKLLTQQQIDAIVTVGAGDKMFWGRLAAKKAGVPVILSAIHSTGWPDGIGRLNRMLTPITDGFIAVAEAHRRHLVDVEGFPTSKVFLVPNGIDTNRFNANSVSRQRIREELGISADATVMGLVAALRPEKNHRLFLEVSKKVRDEVPNSRFVIVGDGPERGNIENWIRELGLGDSVIMTGSRKDIPELLTAFDVFALTSLMEASPVSILEALATKVPVVSVDVGSINESVVNDQTGFLAPPQDGEVLAARTIQLFKDSGLRVRLGEAGRERVCKIGSLDSMVQGYVGLIEKIYESKYLKQESARIELDQMMHPPMLNQSTTE